MLELHTTTGSLLWCAIFKFCSVFLVRFTQAGSEVSALLGRIPSAVGYQPTLATDMGTMQERITTTQKGSITSVQVMLFSLALCGVIQTKLYVQISDYLNTGLKLFASLLCMYNNSTPAVVLAILHIQDVRVLAVLEYLILLP